MFKEINTICWGGERESYQILFYISVKNHLKSFLSVELLSSPLIEEAKEKFNWKFEHKLCLLDNLPKVVPNQGLK